jgi:arginyl-tRNA--protein-N-Asp/Glu arginylyltransferase
VPVDAFRPRADQKKAISELQKLVRQPLEKESDSYRIPSSRKGKGKYSEKWDLEQQWSEIEWNEKEIYDWKFESTLQRKGDMVEAQKQILRPIQQQRCQLALASRRLKSDDKQRQMMKLPPLTGPKRRRFETILRVAESTPEKYKLFRSYQMKVHGESEDQVSSKKGFERFLCESPLMPFTPGSTSDENLKPGSAVDVKSNSPIAYDLYHMEYMYEGKLVAVGVLDILPRSISSVYLFYDPDYAYMHLGKVSAMREMALVKQIQRKEGMEAVQFYNLGLYIHSCPKMRYKAEYHPAEVLDPLTCEWLSHSKVKEKLDRGVRYDFLSFAGESVPARVARMETESDDDDDDRDLPSPPPPGIIDPTTLPIEMLARCLIFDHGRVNILSVSVATYMCSIVDC